MQGPVTTGQGGGALGRAALTLAVLILFFIAAAVPTLPEPGLADAASNDGHAGEDDEHPDDRAHDQYRRYRVIAILQVLWEHGVRAGTVISSYREQRERTLSWGTDPATSLPPPSLPPCG